MLLKGASGLTVLSDTAGHASVESSACFEDEAKGSVREMAESSLRPRFNVTTLRILSLIHAWECQRGKAPIFSDIHKHQEGNLNPLQLKKHLDSLISMGCLSSQRAESRRVYYRVTQLGKNLIESMPEQLSRLQAHKTRISSF